MSLRFNNKHELQKAIFSTVLAIAALIFAAWALRDSIVFGPFGLSALMIFAAIGTLAVRTWQWMEFRQRQRQHPLN